MRPRIGKHRSRPARSLLFESLEPRFVMDSTVVFNEIMYHPADNGTSLEWVELFNQLSVPIDLGGWRISRGVDFEFAEGTTLAGGDYLVVALSPSALQAASGYSLAIGPFTGQLSDSGELLELRDRNDRIMDSIEYADSGVWPVAADGSGASLAKADPMLATAPVENWTFSPVPGGTPGIDNSVIQTVAIAPDSTWKYDDAGVDLGIAWRNPGFNDASWKSGAALFANESDPLPSPTNTTLLPGANTYYFRRSFTFGGNPASVTELSLNAIVDDGAVIYLNGVEVKRLNMPAGAVSYSTHAASEVDNATASGPITIAAANLINGVNVLAVEVHGALPGVTDTLAYYRFEESSGVSIIDAVDGTSHGQLIGGVRTTDVPAPVVPQTGASNNGSVNLTNSRALITGQTFLFHDPSVGGAVGGATLEWYMKVPVADDHSAIFWSNTGSEDANRFNIFWNASFSGAPNSDRSVSGDFLSPSASNNSIGNHANGVAVSLNQWRHFAIVRLDNTPANLTDANFTWNWYIDGALSPAHTRTTSGALPTSNSGWLIAGRQGANSMGVDALIDEVRLTQGALSPGQFLNSASSGGGPGQGEDDDAAFGASLQIVRTPTNERVVINEVSAGGANFQVELVNYGASNLNLAGYVLRKSSGGVDSDFILPSQTLAPGQFAAFTSAQLGFTAQVGDKLFLYSPARETVADGVSVDSVLRGRISDGAGRWYFPQLATFGAANNFVLRNEIVINEIMYHHQVVAGQLPDSVVESPEEWIELYNRGASTVNLSGWRLADAVDYVFPAGTQLAPGGYLVVAANATLLQSANPSIAVIGNFDRNLSNSSDNILLLDAAGNPADEVRYYDESPWAGYADGGGSSLELRDPDADNSRPEAWAASDESTDSPWQTYAYRGIAGPGDSGSPQYNEFILGMLDQGEILLDDISVIEDPNGLNRQLIQNGTFSSGNASTWRIIGTHHGTVVADPSNAANKVLQLRASGRTDDVHNHGETTLKFGSTFVNIVPGREYEISYRAKWVGGSSLLNTRLFFSRLQETTRLTVPQSNGTPGAPNTRLTANVGPTFAQLQQGPALPAPSQPVTVSVGVADPDGIGSVQLRWRVDGGAWTIASMAATGGGRYSGSIPGQPAGTKIQFFVRATDSLGAFADYPAAGESSRALYVVNDGQAQLGVVHNLRLVMSAADLAIFDAGTNLMSNDLLRATLYVNESEVYYDVGVRRSGASSSRQGTHGFQISFAADKLFRGVHESITVDRNHNDEILVRQLINRAGGVPGMYNDLIYFIGPTSNRTGFAQLRLAGFDDVYIDSQFENGGDGYAYEKELIYRQQLSNLANVESLKVPFGYTHPQELDTDIADRGTDPESYRWNWLPKDHRDLNDYSAIIELNQTLSLTGAALDEATRAIMDVDQWLRALAALRLTGNRDVYSQPKSSGATDSWRHNFWAYERPSDGRIIFMPSDIDENFQVSASDPAIFGNENIAKVIQLPDNLHYYWGHLDDLINEAFNAAYMTPWASQFSAMLGGQDMSSGLNYMVSRADYIRSRMPAAEAFRLSGGTTQQTTLVAAGAAAKALIPTNGNLGVAWTGGNEAAFSSLGGDAGWTTGTTGVGFQRAGTDNNFGGLYNLNVAAMDGVNNTAYVRVPFQIASQQALDSITSLTLKMRYDDGFVVYLNGQVVAQSNEPGGLTWNSAATGPHADADAVVPVTIDISQYKSSLKVGANILAIHGLNQASSSDFLILPELVATLSTTTPPVVDTDFVEVSGSGWINVREIRLAGQATAIPVTWLSPTTWTAKAPLAFGVNNLIFEAYDFQGRLIDTPFANSLTVTSTFNEHPYQDFLKLTEVMYHPSNPTASEIAAGFTDSEDFEFFEFFNSSATTSLNLNGVRITNGPSEEFAFAGSDVTSLAPGEHVLVVRSKAAFEARYGTAFSSRIAGQYTGRLDNAGELLVVIDPQGDDIVRFSYDDNSPWPSQADGDGYSLVLLAPRADLSPVNSTSWRPSFQLLGSPGRIDVASGPYAGDYDIDGVVDSADLSVWTSSFGVSSPGTAPVADSDGDQDNDGMDFLTWQRHFGANLVGSLAVANGSAESALSVSLSAAEPTVAPIQPAQNGRSQTPSRTSADYFARDEAFRLIASRSTKWSSPSSVAYHRDDSTGALSRRGGQSRRDSQYSGQADQLGDELIARRDDSIFGLSNG